ncbi:Sperm-associated antigen 6 [Fasciolopsis buskii]|uniref:Sperm-associated antigen 6 n=1 Tax=Fasciolopsis buskii TaxID=27845 RepID=A0A8E0RNP5_9TREM|nr:Sperm-associated antigen 6 [Fasciolopsis buski]
MSQRRILQDFEQYQKARMQFVQTVAELSTQKQNIETLQSAGVMSLLRPLLLDTVPTIQQTAALALGRLANHKQDLAEAVVKEDILPQLVFSLAEQNRFYKKAAAFVLRAVAKHSPELARKVVDCGALDALVIGLEEFDPGVKEGSACALGYIARHCAELAQTVVDAGAVPLLVLCVQEPEISLKRVAASTLADIAKHSSELAQSVVDAGAVAHLAQLVLNPDSGLKRQVYAALSTIAKHSVDLAELVVEAEIFPTILVCLKDIDEVVQKNCATLIRDIVKHTPELSQLVINSGGVAALVDYIGDSKGYICLPGVMALGYIAAHSETLAMAVIVSEGVLQLKCVLMRESKDDIRAAAAWSLGQIGRHTPEHAKAVAQADVLPELLKYYIDRESSEDLKLKTKRALKQIIQKCVTLEALEPLLCRAPSNILKYTVAQFSKVLPHDTNSRRLFVTSGGLKKIQELKNDCDAQLAEYITAINNCYPEEVVRYYSPGYVETLMERVTTYQIPI